MTISLEKRAADAQASVISLLKKEQDRGIELGELVAQVEIAIDYSASMRARYQARGGEPAEVQTVVERALALSLSGLDDDGVVPVHFFASSPFEAELVDRANYAGFVDRWTQGKAMSGTNYAPTIKAILGPSSKKGLFRKGKGTDLEAEKDQPPKFVLFITDGEPFDKPATTKLLLETSTRPIFWQFIGLGYSPAFLQQLDTMGDRAVDNVGLLEYSDTSAMSDTAFFDAVIGEFFTSWLPEARRLGITRR